MNTPLQKVLVLTMGISLLVWAGNITLKSRQFSFNLTEALSDPPGCSVSPDNYGCELNRPFDKPERTQQAVH